jgi:toxin ParE1/3/4
MKKHYVLTKGALADLQSIIRHTHAQWGKAQCQTYLNQIEETATALVKGEGIFKDLSSIYPSLRVAKSGSHFIFCLPRANMLPVILAILHERMDIIARLKNRLEDE